MKSHGLVPPPSFKDERFLRMAIEEARLGSCKTAPNPTVGAVLVKYGRLLGKGHHTGAGRPHAEIEALNDALSSLPKEKDPLALTQGATLYVTLEPCSSHGRTPPCTEAIIKAGIKRVVYGATDPDARHCGRAAKILRAAGIEVVSGLFATECAVLNAHWNHRVATGLPWVIAKAGMSLDGMIDSPKHRRWITSPASRREAMLLRASVEAILVGAQTVRADDPSLTVRGIRLQKDYRGHPQPWRIVWSRTGKLPKEAKIFTDRHKERTIVVVGKSLRTTLKQLAKQGISSVLIEGGGETLGEAFNKKLVNEVRFFIAPVVQGGRVASVGGKGASSARKAPRLNQLSWKKTGPDLMLSAFVSR